MRVFIAVLVLIFSLQSLTRADDISEFEIEGMSIGDSLLDHFDENKIKISLQNSYYYPKSKKFKVITFVATNSDIYERYDIHIKNNDKNYIIYSVKGGVKLSIDKCLIKKKSIISEIEKIFSTAEKRNYKDGYGDSYGKSSADITDLKLTNGRIRVWCADYDQNNEKVKSNRWYDGLWVNISSKEQIDFVINEAYK